MCESEGGREGGRENEGEGHVRERERECVWVGESVCRELEAEHMVEWKRSQLRSHQWYTPLHCITLVQH